MIGTATKVISRDAVEHGVEHAKEAAAELTERINADVVHELRRQARKEIKKAGKQFAEAKKAAKKTAKSAKKSRGRRRGPRPLVLLLVVGGIGVAVYMVQRRRNSSTMNIAPDPFGEAVEEERRAGAFGQSHVATPGA